MPQEGRRRSSDYDAIDPEFPPPSLRTTHTDGRDQNKKKKKWSLGGFFRRKKKASDTDSSSALEDEEEKKGFLEKRRAARKRRNRGSKDVTGSFEIINPSRNQPAEAVEIRNKEVVNDRLTGRSQESLVKKQEVTYHKGSSVSLEGTGRRFGRTQTKAKIEASRERLKVDSSSDEGGGSSRHSISSMQRLRNDETSGSKENSLSRRSRAARTERYKKRISRDEESLRNFQIAPSRISRSDERLSNKKQERASSNSRWTAKVVYCESSDYDAKYTAKTKSATPSPIQSPKARPKNPLHHTSSAPSTSNYVTYPPSHAREGVAGSHQELRSQYPPVTAHKANHRYDVMPPRLPKSSSDLLNKSFSVASQKQCFPWDKDTLNRKSASYDCNVNSIHFVNNQISQSYPKDENVLVVQVPISKPIQNSESGNKYVNPHQLAKHTNPPPPPPRDPHRRLIPTNGFAHETSPRPMSYAFEDKSANRIRHPIYPDFGSNLSAFQRVPQTQPIDIQPNTVIKKHHRSCSDHHIPSRLGSVKLSPPMTRRSSSAQPETISQTYPMNHHNSFSNSPLEELQNRVPNHYQYYTDQQPRSRKPIQITYQNQKSQNDSYLSDSQVILKPPIQQNQRTRPSGVQNAAEFWKQKDQENVNKVHISEGSPKLIQRHLLNISNIHDRSRSNSPHADGNVVTSKLILPPLTMPVRGGDSGSLSSQSSPRDPPSPRTPSGRKLVHNELGIPVLDPFETNGSLKREYRPLSMLEETHEISEQETSPMREKHNQPPTPPTRRDSKVNAVTSFEHFDIFSDDNDNMESGRTSSNLEDALNELEAIYKSLRLGEEGYLEKVAKEQANYENNRLDPSNWNAWVQSRGFESDSSFNYSRSSLESVDSVDSPRKSNVKRSGIPDRVTDDMAYRRLNKKDRPPPHEQEVLSQAGSFLLVSPTLSPPPLIEAPSIPPVKNEPDVTLDDVVYRNIKHVNNSLRVLDPQPPFGIPLGPVTPAPNSDYLHVTPKENYRPTFKPRKTPDVVTDDLAFRNLRKDNNKEPLFSPEDNTLIDSPTLKKKRAVRSLSANLLSIIQKESLANNNNNKLLYNNNSSANDLEKSQSLSDVPNAINISSKEQPSIYELNLKKNLSGEDSDVTPRVSRVFCMGSSSPLITTSTETLTGSKSSIWTTDSKPVIQKVSQNSSPRQSLTPERRHTTEIRNPVSPVKHVPIKIEPLKLEFPLKYKNFRRSPTPDSHTHTHKNDIKDKRLFSAYNETETEILELLAREAKEASEQLSKELNELNCENETKYENHLGEQPQNTEMDTIQNKSECAKFEKTVKNIFEPLESPFHQNTQSEDPELKEGTKLRESHNSSRTHSPKPFAIGKIIPHKAVKLNTFCITADNKLENKQTIVNYNSASAEVEGSKSMTDLLKELTKSLDLDFGNSSKDEEKHNLLKHTNETSTATEEEHLNKSEANQVFSESILPRTTDRGGSKEANLESISDLNPTNELLVDSKEHLLITDSSLQHNNSYDTSVESKYDDKHLEKNSVLTEIPVGQENTLIPYLEPTPNFKITKAEPHLNTERMVCENNEFREEIETPDEQNISSEIHEVDSNSLAECNFLMDIHDFKPESKAQKQNRFPLEIPEEYDDSKKTIERNVRTDVPTPSEDLTDLHRPRISNVGMCSWAPEERSTSCSDLADEGTKTCVVSDPHILLLVCMACAHQLAGLDFLTILGLILALASLILFLVY